MCSHEVVRTLSSNKSMRLRPIRRPCKCHSSSGSHALFSPSPVSPRLPLCPMNVPSLLPKVYPTPPTVIINGYVIETYPSISQVPFASVRDQRRNPLKTAEQERVDELYGRCRTCMGHKSGEQLILCDDCDRAFHMTCLVPILREVPRGEWRCPNCIRDRNYLFRVRATAVVTLRKVLTDFEVRPCLPPKLRLKYLDIPAPAVQFNRQPPCAISNTLQCHDNSPILSPKRCPPSTVPPKRRIRKTKLLSETRPDSHDHATPSVLFKKVATESVRRRRQHISKLADELAVVARCLEKHNVLQSARQVRDALTCAAYIRRDDEFVETRMSDNGPSDVNGTIYDDNLSTSSPTPAAAPPPTSSSLLNLNCAPEVPPKLTLMNVVSNDRPDEKE